MDHNQFLESYHLLNTSLINQVMNRTYHSVGSNIFFEFGKQKEVVLQNGRKRFRREWSIWLSWTSWRIAQHNKYVIGSGENSEVNIQAHLDRLLGKRILSFRFLSQFLDLEINFEDGYKVTTFFNRIEENQWIIFLSNNTEIVIDCSSEKAIECIQNISKWVAIENKYQKLDFLFLDAEVKEFLFGENELLKIICTEGVVIDLGLLAWRLEKHNQYQLGRKDYYFLSIEGQNKEIQGKLLNLVGKKLRCIGTDRSGMDVRLEFEDGYILEIFTHARTHPWRIFYKGEVLLCANVETE